jgi:hypothetical protein
VTDSNIHDTGFTGSPIMSYGEAPVKRRITKLLAVLAGSFVVCVVLLSAWFWFLTSLPLPDNMVAMAVVPAGVILPDNAPDVWKQTVEANRPLPSVLGFARSKAADDKVVPFAVKAFSLADIVQDISAWKLSAEAELSVSSRQSPWKVFGTPWRRLVWLTIWPKKLLNSQSDSLPEVLSGAYSKNIWHVNVNGGDLSLLGSVTSSNAMPLTPALSQNLANFTAANGFQIKFPEKGSLGWEAKAGQLDLIVQPEPPIDDLTYLGLAQGYDLFDKRNSLLQDQTAFQILAPLTGLSATSSIFQTKQFTFHFPLSMAFDTKNNSVRSLACPGQPVALFDNASSKNICSWIDICFFIPRQMIITRQNNGVNFCVE